MSALERFRRIAAVDHNNGGVGTPTTSKAVNPAAVDVGEGVTE